MDERWRTRQSLNLLEAQRIEAETRFDIKVMKIVLLFRHWELLTWTDARRALARTRFWIAKEERLSAYRRREPPDLPQIPGRCP